MVPLSIEHQNQNWCSELFNQQMTAQTWNGRIAQSMSLYWCLINEMNGTWWTVQRTSIWEQQGLCTVLALLFVMIICLALFYIFILGCKLFEAWKLPFFWTVIKYFRSVLFFFCQSSRTILLLPILLSIILWYTLLSEGIWNNSEWKASGKPWCLRCTSNVQLLFSVNTNYSQGLQNVFLNANFWAFMTCLF